MTTHDSFSHELSRIREEGLYRSLIALPLPGGKLCKDGVHLLNFSSNDYLDLATDARLKRAAQEAIERYGCGAGASRLITGHLDIHAELETRLARFMNTDHALVFPSGYQANLGVLTALAGEGDRIFSDELNHASIIDGTRLSRAETTVYRHADMAHLEELLVATPRQTKKFIVSDAVFSMDGDLAPIEQLSELARRFDAFLIIDEAHAFGVFGEGRGLAAERGAHVDVIVGTMSKSLGGGGGFVAASHDICEILINKARSFIFSTALAPATLGSSIEALNILETETNLGATLLERSAYFQAELAQRGFELRTSPSQIAPIIIGENEAATTLSASLLDEGLLVVAVRPPTVAPGTARLRISLSLAHTKEDLTHAAQVLAGCCVEIGVL